MFERYFDPALPSWPPLHLDRSSGEAYVKLRVPDWRSFERAIRASEVLVIVAGGAGIWVAWRSVPPYEEVLLRFILVALVSGVLVAVSVPLVRAVCPPFLARTFFAHRLKISFTRNEVAFRSWLYFNGVRVARRINGQSVTLQFTLENDAEAEDVERCLPRERDAPKKHLVGARILSVIVRGSGEPSQSIGPVASQKFRSIQLACVEAPLGERLSVICNAAADLTGTRFEAGADDQAGEGRDIDFASFRRR